MRFILVKDDFKKGMAGERTEREGKTGTKTN